MGDGRHDRRGDLPWEIPAADLAGHWVPCVPDLPPSGTGEPGQPYPRHLRVDTVLVDARECTSIVRPLTVVFRAAIETGNPVVWR